MLKIKITIEVKNSQEKEHPGKQDLVGKFNPGKNKLEKHNPGKQLNSGKIYV